VTSPLDVGTGDEWLTLRPYALADVADVTAPCQDREISRWTAVVPWPYEEAHAHSWIDSHEALRQAQEAFPFAIVEGETGRFLGTIGVHRPGRPPGSADIGYWVAAWARNQGVATRALELVTAWALEYFVLDRVQLATVVGNRASERVAEKAGYQFIEEVPDWVHPATGGRFQVKRWQYERPAVDPGEEPELAGWR